MSLFKSLENAPKEEKVLLCPKFTNVDLNIQEVHNILSNNIDDTELRIAIKNSYHIFLDDVYLRNEKNRISIIETFTDKRFLKAFIKVLETEQLNDVQKICCNKVAWDYLSSGNVDAEVKELLLSLSYVVNRPLVNVLTTKLDLIGSKLVALARYSSFNERKNVTRVNNILSKINLLSEQQIIDVYAILFRSITSVFEAIMFTVPEDNSQENITKAILDILENIPSSEIRLVLLSYFTNIEYLNIKNLRMDIRKLDPVKYPKILYMIDYLVMNENVTVD